MWNFSHTRLVGWLIVTLFLAINFIGLIFAYQGSILYGDDLLRVISYGTGYKHLISTNTLTIIQFTLFIALCFLIVCYWVIYYLQGNIRRVYRISSKAILAGFVIACTAVSLSEAAPPSVHPDFGGLMIIMFFGIVMLPFAIVFYLLGRGRD